MIAIDGKTVRGARTHAGVAPHLVAAMDHRTGVVLGQLAVTEKSNEIPAVRDLLASYPAADLAGCVITLDAMHTQTDTATAILAAEADFALTVKANQPGLLKRLKTLPWRDVPGHTSTDTGRGRRITRTIKVTAAPAWTGFPGAAQVAQLRRTRTSHSKKTWGVSLPPDSDLEWEISLKEGRSLWEGIGSLPRSIVTRRCTWSSTPVGRSRRWPASSGSTRARWGIG